MKQFLFVIFSFLLFTFNTQAQNLSLITQYEQQLANATYDKARVDAMNKLAAEYLTTTREVEEKYWDKPMNYAKDAAALALKINYMSGLGEAYTNIANLFRKEGNNVFAAAYDYKAQKVKSQLTDESVKTSKDEKQKRLLEEQKRKQGEEELISQQRENDKLVMEGIISKDEAAKRALEIEARKQQLINANQTIVNQKQDIKNKDQEIVQNQEEKERLELQNKIQEQDLKLKDAENENAKKQSIITRGVGFTGLILAVLMALFILFQRRTARLLAAKNKIIEEEKKRSDALLLNILPFELANELKANGSAQARNYESVTVLFTDFKDFTKISERLSPKHLVDEIDHCFRAFDDIVEKYNIEKIKTIGDAYLCAGGIPSKDTHDPIKVVKAALEIRHFIDTIKAERQGTDRPYFEIRIGIHTGPLVAGVVGSKKFAYDIWGDTVNTAARMEQNSEPGQVNISEATYQLVKEYFNCTHRGKLYAKNKGEIDMYFVDSGV
jgi:adenylate cyclase